MRLLSVLILFVSVGLAPSLLEAKEKTYSKKQEVNFEETAIDGQARTPDGVYVNQKREMKFFPLYKVKDNFKKNIRESAEYLR